MMEKRKRYRIADAEIEIAFTENYTEIICRDYEVKAEGKPDFVIEVTDEEVEREKKKSEPGASKGIIESLAIYRKLCEKILDRNCVLFHCSAVAVLRQTLSQALTFLMMSLTVSRRCWSFFMSRSMVLRE